MNVAELRTAFLFGSEIEHRLRAFRQDRVEMLRKDEGALALHPGPRLVFHIVPLSALTDNVELAFDKSETGIIPLGARGHNHLRSIDGYVTYSGPEEKFQHVRAFSTLFRNGIIEAAAQVHSYESGGRFMIDPGGIEEDLITHTYFALQMLRKYNCSPPYYLMLSLAEIRGAHASPNPERGHLLYPYRSDVLGLPAILVDQATAQEEPKEILRPLFDLLWNAFGRFGSPLYDRDRR